MHNCLNDAIHSRYQSVEPLVFVNSLPWVPLAVIIDAIFIINTTPLRRATTMIDYTMLLFREFELEHYNAETVIFDKVTEKQFSPKYYKHVRQRNIVKHVNTNFTLQCNIPQGWREYLMQMKHNRSYWNYILRTGKVLLSDNQKLFLAECFSGNNNNCAWIIRSADVTPEIISEYTDNCCGGRKSYLTSCYPDSSY